MNRCWAGYAFFAMILILSLSSMLSACGVKGPLYLPTEEQKSSTQTDDSDSPDTPAKQ